MSFTQEQLTLPQKEWRELLIKNGIKIVPNKIKVERRKALNRVSAKKSASKKLQDYDRLKLCVVHLVKRCKELENENNELKEEIKKNNNINLKNDQFWSVGLDILDFNI
jgi:uncharacterized membrane-anchored protein YjiN (DUF445 family)